ncbi:MAG: glycosyltransferase, partial [Bdellovibrionales bacterium]|nr:glycosyltransferase [Bdellovibrionales bacterium]
YNAEQTITKVLERLPSALFSDERYATDVLIIDDCSPDNTFQTGFKFAESFEDFSITILQNPKNLGYGGNQKVGYTYAIRHGYDHVILLHGDGQYAPEELPRLLEPLIEGSAEAVFGSRMINGKDALAGGMPKYKYLGNKVLTWSENFLAGTRLSEYHSGLRLYACRALAQVPFQYNEDYFDFDTDIILQFHEAGHRIKELPIPTFYGDEVCHVDGIKYARKIMMTCLLYRVQKWGIFYHPKFDIKKGIQYSSKHHFQSSHKYALDFVSSEDNALLVSEAPDSFCQELQSKANSVDVINPLDQGRIRKKQRIGEEGKLVSFLNQASILSVNTYQKLLLLDVLEHVDSAEGLLRDLRESDSLENTELLFTVGNIGFLPVRVMLFFGSFNYGRHGILDKAKKRLFTFRSLRTLLESHGFEIVKVSGIPAPYPLAFGDNIFSSLLLTLNSLFIKVSRRIFSYQIAIEAQLKPNVTTLLKRAITNTESLIQEEKEKASSNS